MRIKHLKLSNFRNHKKTEVDFGNTNILLGPNGSGKTSILEAIFILSTSKSPRTNKNFDLINWKKNQSLLELIIYNKRSNVKTIRLLLSRNKNKKNKTFSLDGKVTEPKDVIGYFKTVYFSPETLEIINGSPTERRRFIDILLSQTSHAYLVDLIEYKKILINRNRLLKEIYLKRRGKDEIVFWDMKLVEVGSRIMRSRIEAINTLKNPIEAFHRVIINKKSEHSRLEICYHPSFMVSGSVGEIKKSFIKKLTADFEFELKCGNTLYGPHRDDLNFRYSGHDVLSFCSRGEIRSIIIALKMAEAEYIKKKTGDLPVILLDDIFSELDAKRTKALSGLVFGGFQSIISATERGLIKMFKDKKIKTITLAKKLIYV